MDEILVCRNLYMSYHGTQALNGINLELPKGKVVGLLGPNGSGKTTLIKLIMGMLTPESGEIIVDGKPLSAETKSIVAYLPDKNFLPQGKTVKQAMDFYCDFFADFRRDRAEQMLVNLGINPEQKIKTLSKGNQEKVGLILTMSRDAKLYLLDEPIAGVDPATRDYILNTIISNYSENATILLSTHLIADVEPVLSDVIFLNRGNISLFGGADELREQNGKSIDMLFREVFKC
ncbi:MAG: ABC transporter ATP-binding protein [Clostridiales bacterium]|nr:ABC transporter ATP-binding protein [Clostridiales bacterium]